MPKVCKAAHYMQVSEGGRGQEGGGGARTEEADVAGGRYPDHGTIVGGRPPT